MPISLAGAIAAELGEGSKGSSAHVDAEEASAAAGAAEEGFCDLAAAISAEVGHTRGTVQPKVTQPEPSPPGGTSTAPAEETKEVEQPEPSPLRDTSTASAEETRDAPAPSSNGSSCPNTRGSRFASFVEGGGAGTSAAAAALEQEENKAPVQAFAAGDEVEVVGLKSQFGEQLNGQIGMVTRWVETKGRYMVRFGAGESDVNLRPENLRKPGLVHEGEEEEDGAAAEGKAAQAQPSATAAAPLERPAATAPSATPQPSVQAEEAERRSDQEGRGVSPTADQGDLPGAETVPGTAEVDAPSKDQTNGQANLPSEHTASGGPSTTATAAEEPCPVAGASAAAPEESKASAEGPATPATPAMKAGGKPELSLQVGDHATVFGLESDSGRKLNGQQGVIRQYDETKDRFQVEFPSGNQASLKATNLKRTAEQEAVAAAAAAPADLLPGLGVAIGDIVQVSGLTSGTGTALNGQRGFTTAHDANTGRLEVRCQSGTVVSVKPARLQLVHPVAATPCPEKGESCGPALECGDVVVVAGLQSEAGKALNGKLGILSKCDGEERVEVLFAVGNPVRLRPENLVRLHAREGASQDLQRGGSSAAQAPLDLASGDSIQVCGLESERGRAMNGQTGVVRTYCAEKMRYEVSLESGDIVNLKLENMRLLVDDVAAAASKDSSPDSAPVDEQPDAVLASLGDEERLLSVQKQLLALIDTEGVQAQLDSLRGSAKNMRQYGKELETLLRPIRDTVYRRHGVDRNWHLSMAEEHCSVEQCQALEDRLRELCGFEPPVGRDS